MFKVGDKVKRIANVCDGDTIVYGGVYSVSWACANAIEVEGHPGSWDPDKFESVDDGAAPSPFTRIATEVGELVTEKNKAYGDSFVKAVAFLKLLWPNGIPLEAYGDVLTQARIFDKQMRIATAKDAFGEDPYRDIVGYGVLAVAARETAK